MDFAAEDTLFQACRILFGPETSVSRNFLFYLRPSGISRAFRRKALSTHPDRLVNMDEETRKKSTELFIEADWAREQLMNFCKRRDSVAPPKERRRRSDESARFHSGPLPQCRLRFGEFLYYSGIVTWNGLIKAIVWQRRQRPRFGDIAKRWRYLSEQDLRWIVLRKKFCEPIGETAVRMSTLSQFQVNTILFHQMFIQRPIGEYFVEHGYLLRPQLDGLLRDFKQHNSLFAAKP